jgi:hypothetical protein
VTVDPVSIGNATVRSWRPGVFNLPSKSAEISLTSALGERLPPPPRARRTCGGVALGDRESRNGVAPNPEGPARVDLRPVVRAPRQTPVRRSAGAA